MGCNKHQQEDCVVNYQKRVRRPKLTNMDTKNLHIIDKEIPFP